MKRKITMTDVILSLLGMIILIFILDKLFLALFKVVDLPEFYAHLIGFVVPGAAEIFNIILPYLKQNKIINWKWV